MSGLKRTKAFHEAGKSVVTTDEKITDQIHSMGLEQRELPELTQEQSKYDSLDPTYRMPGFGGYSPYQSHFISKENQHTAHQEGELTHDSVEPEPECIEQEQSHLEPMDIETYRNEVQEHEQRYSELQKPEEEEQQTFDNYAASEWESLNLKFDEKEKAIASDKELSEKEKVEAMRELMEERAEANTELTERLNFEGQTNGLDYGGGEHS